jgi:hypothetical protein
LPRSKLAPRLIATRGVAAKQHIVRTDWGEDMMLVWRFEDPHRANVRESMAVFRELATAL